MIKNDANLIVIGAFWGDEGKGKIIDLLSSSFNNVVRSQGGDNAGHTIVVDGVKHKLRLLPSGVLYPNKNVILGNGVALNLETILTEVENIKKINNSFKLFISERASVIMPYHIAMDELTEEVKADQKVGTTKRGIGPCYEDKTSRFGLRVVDLLDYDSLLKKISLSLKFKNPVFKTFGKNEFNPEKIAKQYYDLGQKIKSYICNTSIFLESEFQKNNYALFEGAQGVMLCLDHGTYPYVTSSSPTAASVALGNGIRINEKYRVLGVMKAYISRVGEGPFVSEIHDNIADEIRERGNEYGTVTKRPRRIGWLDLVVLKHSIRVSSIDILAITLLDVLSGLDEIKVCTEYLLTDTNTKTNIFPASCETLNNAKPIYTSLKSWKEDISKMTTYEELPLECKNYLSFIEQFLGIKIVIISNGPDRKNTIFKG